MTRYCEQLYPGVKFATVDARSMKEYRDGQFAFVIFSFNGIDSVPPEDRLAILKECHRVLRPGGLFAFSTHNIEKPVRSAFHLSNIEFSLQRANPILQFFILLEGLLAEGGTLRELLPDP